MRASPIAWRGLRTARRLAAGIAGRFARRRTPGDTSRRLTPMLVAWAGAILHGAAQGAQALPAPEVEPVAPCFALPSETTKVDYRYDCGYVVVPENRAIAGGRTVKLGYLRLRSRTQTREPPLFMLAGGPGGSLIVPSLFDLFQPALLGPILDRRDVVVLDQRGTRHTVPHLNCPEFNVLPWTRYSKQLTPEAGAALESAMLERCVDGFRRQGVDLAQYNSVALAADVDGARRALGYDRIVYYGASYGSQLGQHVMRDFPSMLEAVILDGTSALSRRSWVEDRAIDLEFSLHQLDALCREEAQCRAAFDVPALLRKGQALFEQGPIQASFVDPGQPGKSLPIVVGQVDFARLVYEKRGYKIGVSSLPFILAQLTRDGRARLVVFPDGTHVQVGAVNRCAMKTIAQFLDDPRGELDTACLRDHGLPGFVLPDGTVSKR
jgi:pimeloyl-ACP methyl ester carboxylesterase